MFYNSPSIGKIPIWYFFSKSHLVQPIDIIQRSATIYHLGHMFSHWALGANFTVYNSIYETDKVIFMKTKNISGRGLMVGFK